MWNLVWSRGHSSTRRGCIFSRQLQCPASVLRRVRDMAQATRDAYPPLKIGTGLDILDI
jgi:hypothetical protein